MFHRSSWLLAGALLSACGSDAAQPASTDTGVADSSTSDATTDTAVDDTSALDTFEAATCTLSGACFDDFLAHQKKASACFGHFGPGCGTFDGAGTTCKWDDGASFVVVAEDGGGSSVVYKGKDGTECFRRLASGDLVFPDGASYSSVIKVAASPEDNTLTIGCKGGSPFTCKLQPCIDCGIDVRTCCK